MISQESPGVWPILRNFSFNKKIYKEMKELKLLKIITQLFLKSMRPPLIDLQIISKKIKQKSFTSKFLKNILQIIYNKIINYRQTTIYLEKLLRITKLLQIYYKKC